jgi:hypothetical protein
MELVDIEYRREPVGWVLRLTIDKGGGVTLDDCTRVSQEIGRSLDVEDVIPNPYHLEVSSPGLDRPLKNERDFIRFSDRRIRVKTMDPMENKRLLKESFGPVWKAGLKWKRMEESSRSLCLTLPERIWKWNCKGESVYAIQS